MSDSEQCSNRFEFDLISLLVNISCKLGPIMTRYDFLWGGGGVSVHQGVYDGFCISEFTMVSVYQSLR